jgi:general stress protein 26
MPTPQELERNFWNALADDMTMMLGLHGVEDGHTRPMTAQFEKGRTEGVNGARGPIYFFTTTDNVLVRHIAHGHPAIATFTDKGHNLFATLHGTLSRETDPAVLDRLWNSFVAAWYEGGKTDPKLALLRLDPEQAEIWENASSLLAGLKLLLGSDPKQDYRDKVATVNLRH